MTQDERWLANWKAVMDFMETNHRRPSKYNDDNRDYCKENGIQTSFVKRGGPFSEDNKGKDLVRKELARVRATAMEGSFGTQKEHYDLRRVKARTKLTEILYIFFGIHTANVVQLADRIEQRAQLAAS